MATAGDGMAPYERVGAGEKYRKRQFQPENSTGKSSDEGESSTIIPAATGISEFEQMLKQGIVTRSKIQHTKTIEDLPDEILSNIFIRLLSRQLAQMRSVSKSWNALLSDPSFVKSHLHRSIRNNNQQILLAFSICSEKPFTQYSCQSPHFEPINFIKHTPTNPPMRVFGAVNGLICFSKYSYSNILIWNPSLSAMSAVPPPHSLSTVPPRFTPPTRHRVYTYMRFGFDPKTDDYKIVKLEGVYDYTSHDRLVKKWLKVETYSMRKRCWEFVTQPFPSHITGIYSSDYVCVDGHDGRLHWENKTGLLKSSVIVGFDLGSETFHEIPLPESILDSNHISHRLGILGGKLCEISCCKDGGWEVWVMEEYGVPESWAKHHSPQFNKGVYLYGFTSRHEVVLQDGDGRLVLYDPITNKTKSTRITEHANKFVEYEDSLIWI